jgi:hypothetical protein
MITLTRVTAEGMKGHVSYTINTGRIALVPSEVTAVSELSTDRYGKYTTVTELQIANDKYCVIEDYDTVMQMIAA